MTTDRDCGRIVNTPVYCAECGKPIAFIKYLMTPTQFMSRYGDRCKICGHKFYSIFNIGKGE